MLKEKKNKLILISIILTIIIISIIISYLFYKSASELEKQKQTLENELSFYNSEINTLNNHISTLNSNIRNKRNTLNDTIEELELRESDEMYYMHNPTYSEVIKFIQKDTTDKKRYDEDTFNCGHYSMEVNNNAESQGIRCCYVTVNFSGGAAHALVAFETTDKGILYIEPQSDEKVNLEIGKDYWADCVVEKSSRYYYPRDSDNIVMDFELFW